jgi:hypothetical protein
MAFRDSINDLMFRFYERFKQNNNRLPVSVDADINVGAVQIGTVKQGAKDAEAEPWDVNVANDSPLEVQIKGRLEGLSTDTKPTLGPDDRGSFFEWDTQDLYYWDGSQWVVVN